MQGSSFFKKTQTRGRFWIAYLATAEVLSAYLFLQIQKKLFGRAFYERRILRVHEVQAQRILKTILRLKGLFIKMGQMISVMTPFLPRPLTQVLEALQDAVPPHPYDPIQKRIFEELGDFPEKIFLEFDPIPIASASLGQVHRATLPDGQKVVVKVQYPEMEVLLRADLKILRRIFGIVSLFFPRHGLAQTHAEISQSVISELSFLQEAKNLERIRENFKENTTVLFPKVFKELSTDRVLTLEWMEGVKISNLEELRKAGILPSEVAQKLIHVYCQQLFVDGVYHADPHPGNFLIQPGPKIVMLDFGAMAQVSEPMRKGAILFVGALIRRDSAELGAALKEMGFIAKGENEQVFDRLVDFFYDRLKHLTLNDLQSFDLSKIGNFEDLLEFKSLDLHFSDLLRTLNVPKDWALMERALMMLFALSTHLDPAFNPLSIILPYVERMTVGPSRVSDLAFEFVQEVAISYLRLPTEMHKTLRKLNQGGFKNIGSSLDETRLSLRLHQLNLTLLVFGCAGFGFLLEARQVSVGPFFYYGSGFFALLLAKSFFGRPRL